MFDSALHVPLRLQHQGEFEARARVCGNRHQRFPQLGFGFVHPARLVQRTPERPPETDAGISPQGRPVAVDGRLVVTGKLVDPRADSLEILQDLAELHRFRHFDCSTVGLPRGFEVPPLGERRALQVRHQVVVQWRRNLCFHFVQKSGGNLPARGVVDV